MSFASPNGSPADASPSWIERAAVRRRRVIRQVRHAAIRLSAAAAIIATSGAAGAAAWRWLPHAAVDAAHQAQVARETVVVATAVGATMATLAMLAIAARAGRGFDPIRRLTRQLRQARAASAGETVLPLDAEMLDADPDTADLIDALNEQAAAHRSQRADLVAEASRMHAQIAELGRQNQTRATQLNAANERLQAEIAEKEDFVRAISHDLNAPLRNIGGMVTMLLTKDRDALPEEVVHRLERIKSNVEVQADLIHEMLEFSRIKTRRQQMHLVDVERVVWELRGLFEHDLKAREIELVVETSLPQLFAERVRVRQVFQNLIDNAIKYMGEGSGAGPDGRPRREIRVGCRVSVGEAEFYVRDTGVGIAKDDQEKVFVIFRRGTDETTRKVAGKGVGLASVKSIVETYAGRIWVESERGVGTTFRFTINGQYVPAVSGQVPDEMAGQATRAAPTLAA